MGLLSWFTKAPEKVVDIAANLAGGAVNGLDAIWYTEEEKDKHSIEITKLKTELTTKTMDIWLKVQEKTANENSIRSITRRILAVAFISVYLIHMVAGSIVYQFNKEYATHLFSTAKSMSTIVMTIVVFYFGYYAISNVLSTKRKK